MQKSIKKIIASAVAGLMVISSMPFVALAAPGDYEPDLQLQFTPFYDGDEGDWGDYSSVSSTTCYQSAGLSNIPLHYDEEAGTLTGKVAEMNAYNEYWEVDPVEEDWELGVGDFFATTIRLDNVDIAASGNFNIRFSDNLTPAGLGSYTYKEGKKTKTGYKFFNEDDKPTGYADDIVGFREPISDWSASDLYEGMNDTVLGDLSCIQEDPTAVEGDGWSDLMMTATLVCQGDYIDVSSVDSSLGFFDIKNGTYDADNGYTYDNQFIMATFVFQITGEGPIQFDLQDPEGTKDPKLNGAVYFAKKSETLDVEAATTYAKNTYIKETDSQGGDTEWPGSMKMTFMGKNVNRGEEPPAHTHTPGEAVRENEVAATCTTDGSYDEVIYCTECGEEISRETKKIDALQHDYTAVVTEPTCTEQGYTTYTCKRGDSTYVDDYTDALDHSYVISSIDWDTLDTATGQVTANYVCERDESHTTTDKVQTTFEVTQEATEDQPELTTYMYSAGEFHSETTVQTAPALEHTHVPAEAVRENEVPASCSEEGSYDEVIYCSKCGEEISRTKKTIDKIAHTPGEAVRENEVPASCSAEGSYDEVIYCTECHTELSRTQKTIDKIAHTPGEAVRENEVPASCSEEGSYDEVIYCTECKQELSRTNKKIDKIAHTPGEAVKENEVAPTKETAGSYDEVIYCTECNEEISRTTKTVDALGVTITLAKSDIGYVEGDLEVGANKLAFGAKYTVTAVPVDGAKFVGWEVGGNIVSKNATYTTTAASDITITPVFEDATSDNITVTFFDKYGNTVKQYKDMTADQYQEAIAADYDTLKAPEYPSYTFKAWDKTKDEILAISESTTVWAQYDQQKVTEYTVTTNAELILPDGVENEHIPYDTKVTVRDTAAKAWRVGEAIVAYGPEYTFYVGSDVTVAPVYETVEEKATTTVIGASLVNGSDYKFNIVATRNVPDGYEVVDYGFVYGKNLTDDELDLDKVGTQGKSDNAGAVKAVHAGTRNLETNEFAFNYGIKSKNAPVTAKSFVTVVKGGKTEIVYSDMFTQNY
ncbi:MAG: hypothetical protein IJR70_09245 [Eubacterium sp.]|nr:hypothetical protein [Eubacterium sp.]